MAAVSVIIWREQRRVGGWQGAVVVVVVFHLELDIVKKGADFFGGARKSGRGRGGGLVFKT